MDVSGNFTNEELDFSTVTQTIDVAAIGQPLSAVTVEDNMHIENLDTIGSISVDEFKSLFYYRDGDIFHVNPSAVLDASATSLISFSGEYRTVRSGDASFNLTESIFESLESDLGVKRECFDLCSKIELSKELSRITTLVDIENCVVLCALRWSDIKRILVEKGNKMGKVLAGPILESNGSISETIVHRLIISVIFKNPNVDTKDVLIRFPYAVRFGEGDL